MPVVALKTEHITVSQLSKTSSLKPEHLDQEQMKGISWLEDSTLLLDKNAVEKSDTIAWSAFRASKENASTELHTSVTQLLPFFMKKQQPQQ